MTLEAYPSADAAISRGHGVRPGISRLPLWSVLLKDAITIAGFILWVAVSNEENLDDAGLAWVAAALLAVVMGIVSWQLRLWREEQSSADPGFAEQSIAPVLLYGYLALLVVTFVLVVLAAAGVGID